MPILTFIFGVDIHNIIESITTTVKSLPTYVIFIFFIFGAGMRSQSFYWMGKLAYYIINRPSSPVQYTAAAKLHNKLQKKAHDKETQKTIEQLQTKGLILIPLSFITIGLQSLVQLSAGIINLAWWKYTLIAIPGWILWASIYTFASLAIIKMPATTLALAIIIGLGVYIFRTHHKRKEHE
ncbi:MAG: hypothetical protein J6M18_05575 [Actinomycetaceae bacterium]|nr:hypothetical protein [Actinomycetaceae bacterium]